MVDLNKVAATLRGKFKSAGIASETKDPIDFVSTGNLAFDLISDGGVPFGYVAEFLGLSQSGKCLGGDTKVFLKQHGLIKLKDLAKQINCIRKDEVTVIKENILSGNFVKESNHFYSGGEVSTIKIKTSKGFNLEAEPTHKLKVLTEDIEVKFKSMEDVEVGDYLALGVSYNDLIFNKIPADVKFDGEVTGKTKEYTLPTKMTNELAELMGYAIANGSSTSSNNIYISSMSNDVKARIFYLGKVLFGKEFFVGEEYAAICSKQIKGYLTFLNAAGKIARDKIVPTILWSSTKEHFLSFLSAYFTCDGYVDKHGRIEFCSASKDLIDSISFFLLGEGILHRVRNKEAWANNSKRRVKRTYYHLYIDSKYYSNMLLTLLNLSEKHLQRTRNQTYRANTLPYCHSLISNIFEEIRIIEKGVGKYKFPRGGGFRNYLGSDLFDKFHNIRYSNNRSAVRKDTLIELYNKLTANKFPNRSLCSKLAVLIDNTLFYDRVVDKTTGVSNVYDLSVPSNKQYTANNFIVHNSTFIQALIANAQQKYDAIGILVDRENAYTNKRGEQLGIVNEKLLRVKPSDTPLVYDAFNFIIDSVQAVRGQETKVKEKSYIVIGIDSISSFDKDVALDKADPGRKAKAVHESLRKILTLMDHRTMLLIANQVTYKVGVAWGDPKTTTAGESMKYYSTMRFALEDKRKIIDERRGKEVVGNWLGVEVIKTRLGPCYRTCYIPVSYSGKIPYYGGYARLLAQRGYLKPKNKDEFTKFKQRLLTYNKEDVNEFDIEKFLEQHPELLFEKYPEYNLDETDKNV